MGAAVTQAGVVGLWVRLRTTMQPQLVVELVELVLDVLGTGTVLARTEVQQHVDLQTQRRGERAGGQGERRESRRPGREEGRKEF